MEASGIPAPGISAIFHKHWSMLPFQEPISRAVVSIQSILWASLVAPQRLTSIFDSNSSWNICFNFSMTQYILQNVQMVLLCFVLISYTVVCGLLTHIRQITHKYSDALQYPNKIHHLQTEIEQMHHKPCTVDSFRGIFCPLTHLTNRIQWHVSRIEVKGKEIIWRINYPFC